MSSTTVQQLINRVMGSSAANDPGVTITETELVIALQAELDILYVRAAGINPFFYATSETKSPNSEGGWDRPANAVSVLLIKADGGGASKVLTSGQEVHLVPLNDRTKAENPPRVYKVGACYFSVDEAGDPAGVSGGDDLCFYYAGVSPVISLQSTLPAWYPKGHETLLMVKLAKFVALKDKNRGDVNEWEELEAKLEEAYDFAIRNADMNLSARFGNTSGMVSHPVPETSE